MAEDRRQMWKMTAIGLVIAAIVAVVTGIVVANRTGTNEAKLAAPSASPSTTVNPQVAQAPTTPPPAAQPTTPAPAPSTSAPVSRSGVPPQSVVAECNRVAEAQGGPEKTRNDKIVNAAKDAGIGALGGAAVGALGGGIASGGKGAGKGALIGGGDGAADQRQRERLDHHRHHHGRAAEADCAQGGDLGLAAGDRGVHAVERAEGGADGHEGGDAVAEHADELRQDRRLLRVVLGLAQDIDGQAAVATDRVLEPGEAGLGGIGEGRRDRLEARTPEGGHRDLGVRPDLRFVHVTAALEGADDRPVAVAERDARADREPRELLGRLAAHDDLAHAARVTAALDDADLVANG